MIVLFLAAIFTISPVMAAAVDATDADCSLALVNPIATEADALITLKQEFPRLNRGPELTREDWFKLLENFSVPAVQANSPLLVMSLVGGGNAGKSTLMNAFPSLITQQPGLFLNEPVTAVGFYPGLTKRMVIAVSPAADFANEDLRLRFGTLNRWANVAETAEEGPGLVVTRSEIPQNIALVDAPDFDTGAPASSEPDNLQRLRRVFYPSDVLIFVLDAKTVRNLANLKMLNKLFKNFGQKSAILVLQMDPAIAIDEARDLLLQFANNAYGRDEPRFPPAVLGAYISPYSSQVAAGKAFPGLVPISPFPEFADLIQSLNAKSSEVKKFSLENAAATVGDGARRYVRSRIKVKLALQIYAKAIDVASVIAANNAVENFNYYPLRKSLRAKFNSYASRFATFVHEAGSLAATPDRLILSLLSQVRTAPSLSKQIEIQHGFHDRLAISSLFLMLKNERIPAEQATQFPAAVELKALTEKFYGLFPEERKVPAQSAEIALPASALLPYYVRKQLHEMLQSDPEKLAQMLSESIANDQRPAPAMDPNGVGEVLAKIAARQSVLRQIHNGAVDFATLAAPIVAGKWLADHSIDNTLVWLAAIVVSARPFRTWSDYSVDRFLNQELNQWHRQLQERVTLNFFSENLTLPLQGKIAEEEENLGGAGLPAIQLAIQKILQAARGESYPPLPLHLN